MDALDTARACALFADDKKAENILLLDLRGLSPVTDFFVICTATSSPHLRAVRDEVVEQMREVHRIKPLFVDGTYESQWLIINFPNVLVHIQSPEKREYYALQELWGDAPQIPWEKEVAPPKPANPSRASKATKVAKKATPAKKGAKKAAASPAKKAAKTAKKRA